MKRIRSRAAVINGIFLALVGLAWFCFAPTRVGGSTTYVVTHGVSMEPRFHSGDLVLVRGASQYKVGDIVAYHSSLLRMVVMHRIVTIDGGHYTFKGDNNNFLDPVHPTRSQLVGKLWLHLPRAGVLLNWLHTPLVDGVLFGLVGLILLSSFGEKERRRRRRRRQDATGSPSRGRPLVSTPRDPDAPRVINFGALLAASAVAVAAFLALSVFAFTRPTHRTVRRSIPYSQQVRFGYSAHVRPGPVYPDGRVTTSGPIFLSIVHDLDVHIAYRFSSGAPASVAGTEEVRLNVMGPSGWTRSFVLVPATRFAGDSTSTEVTLDLRQLQSLMSEIERLTATPGFGAFSMTVQPIVRIRGVLANHPINTAYEPALGFQVQSDQLAPASGSAPASSSPGTPPTSGAPDYAPSQAGAVATPESAPGTLTALGASIAVTWLRWISLGGLLISILAAAFFYLRKRGEPFEESVRIQAQYGNLIVPIVAGEDLGWPPVDVPNIKALVRLAESGQRLILHNRSQGVDTYMVNDEGTVYRYQVRPSNVVWGEWSEAAAPVHEAAA